MYYVHNTLELNYVFMPVPGPKPRSVLLFGPFLYEAASGPFFERVLAQKQAFLFFGRAAPVFAEQVQAFFIGNFIVRNFFGEGG